MRRQAAYGGQRSGPDRQRTTAVHNFLLFFRRSLVCSSGKGLQGETEAPQVAIVDMQPGTAATRVTKHAFLIFFFLTLFLLANEMKVRWYSDLNPLKGSQPVAAFSFSSCLVWCKIGNRVGRISGPGYSPAVFLLFCRPLCPPSVDKTRRTRKK